jgi:serine/threonine protein kinase
MLGESISHYRILRKLGGGGMGVVFEAADLKLGRRVALKFLPEELAKDRVALERFQREARAASSLNHPNICTIFEIDEANGQPFIAMELLEGQTLRQKVMGKGLNLETILDLGIQIASALEAAHSKGIVHRDLKPANIFVTNLEPANGARFRSCQARKGGLCRRRSRRSHPHRRGTTYKSRRRHGHRCLHVPEQVAGKELDGCTDLFSFGAVLYDL